MVETPPEVEVKADAEPVEKAAESGEKPKPEEKAAEPGEEPKPD